MIEVGIIGLDLAKNVFQAHGAGADGSVVFRRKLARVQVLKFFAEQPRCTVAMEACASAHHWARAIAELGHAVKLIPPAYVKPFVKRQKNDMADAEAIAGAAARPTMRIVAPKSAAQQAAAMAFRTRELLVRQRTQTINALRGRLSPRRRSPRPRRCGCAARLRPPRRPRPLLQRRGPRQPARRRGPRRSPGQARRSSRPLRLRGARRLLIVPGKPGGLGYLPFARTGGQLPFHLVEPGSTSASPSSSPPTSPSANGPASSVTPR